MKKGLLFVLLLISFLGFGQCPPYPGHFSSQASIDNFAINYPNCTEINSLDIEGDDITNLNGLSQLTYIRELFIYYTLIEDFQGLENVGEMNYFRIEYNHELLSFSGLSALTSIGANPNFSSGFRIDHNDKLNSFDGLQNLSEIYNYMDILDNDLLQNFNGLNGLTTIHGNFNVLGSKLVNFTGLENLSLITETLTIRNNITLTSMDGLEGLNEITKYLEISSSPYLQNLNGLQNLTQVGPSVTIANNYSLNSLSGLENLNTSNFYILDNQTLSQCAIYPVCSAIAQPGQFGLLVSGNAYGCENIDQIRDRCQLSITEADFSENLSVFPNPVISVLNIENSNTISFEKATIYSTLGKQILETSEKQINLETLSAGIYFVEVVTDKGNVTKKIIKQ